MDNTSLSVPKLKIGKGIGKSSEFLNGGYDSSEGDNIKVYVRVRPPDKLYESEFGDSLCLEVTASNSLTLLSKPEPKIFTYDHVADVNTTQEEVFSLAGKKIIEGCVAGYNGTIFAYGQTGSGKTFTMIGPPDDSDNFDHERRGVIPRGFEYLFSLINREQEKHGNRVEFLCRSSFLEIYNEQIYDLLDPASAGLQLREDIKKGVFVKGLKEVDISNAKDAHEVLTSGWTNRRVAATSMNRESSRSHAVFTVSIESKEKKEGMANIKLSQLHLVDLAGSERQKDTHTEGLRLKEAANINKSLSALGNVIMALVDLAHGKQRHVHYRDSKLTFILRDSLGGNARTYIIANIHPSAKCFGETLSTLNFARRAKMIRNKAIVNEDVSGNVAQLQSEIRKLKELLSKYTSGAPVETMTQDSSSEESSTADYDSGIEISRSRNSCLCGSNTKNWKEMMLSAISEREKTEEEKKELVEKVHKMEELCSRKEKFLQSTKMILKFRENHIAKLEKSRKKDIAEESEDLQEKEIQLLKDEIKCLQDKVEHHPEVARFAMENLDLRAEIKRLKSIDVVSSDSCQDMAKTHRYTMQLERQLKEYMTSAQSSDLEKSLSSSLQSLEASNSEVDRLKLECAQMQSKFDATTQELQQNRQELQQAREELVEQSEKFRKKELELQSELSASRKTNNELERALESFHLKSAVERTALNDIHMQTIKTLTSPLKFGTPNKASPWRNGTLKPRRLNQLNSTAANESGDLEGQFISEEKPISSPEKNLFRRDSLNDTDDEEEYPFFDFENESQDAEVIYCEALLEEVKKLQDLNSKQLQQLQAEEAKRITVNQQKLKLQHQVDELESSLEQERQQWTKRESEFSTQVTTLTDQLKHEQGEKSVLKSEVEDLKIILQSTDRKYDTFKREKNQESLEAGRKIAAIESKLVKLEVDYFNLQNEMEETLQLKQHAQSELETCQEELGFMQHKNSELENLLTKEKERVKNLENSLKNALEKLEMEMAINLKLTEENKEQEVVRAVEHTNELRNELISISKKCEDQERKISTLSMELSEANTEINHLKRLSASDKEAVNKLLMAAQDLRIQLDNKETHISRLTDELEETRRQQEELAQSYTDKKKKVARLSDALKTESEKLGKEKSARENEVAQLKEDLFNANMQYEELSELFYQQQKQLAAFQAIA